MGALTLLITGAAGYVGRHTVAAARERGHRVIAVVRSEAGLPGRWQADDDIEVLVCDLSAPQGLEAACARADVVLHLAAALSGDAEVHQRDTLDATAALLAALPESAKLVLLGSMAVYDMDAVAPGEMISERSALLAEDGSADTYAVAKREQERLAETVAKTKVLALTVLRAGAVFGPGRLWNAHLGWAMGPVLLRLAARGQIPICHVSTCTEALLNAAERPAMAPVNVLDEDLPDRKRYLAALRGGPRVTLPLNWRWLMPLARAASKVTDAERLPGLLRPTVLRARFLPVSFDNSRMRSDLGVRQAHAFEALMHEAQA